MVDKEKINIVDSQGNVLKSAKDNKVKYFFENNVWNILGTGVATIITLTEIVKILISNSFSQACADFYGIDKKYFSGKELFEDKVIFVLCAIILFVYPIIISYINQKINNKIYIIVMFLLTIFILFIQNVMYTVELIDNISVHWLKKCIDNYVTLGIFCVSDIIIAYFVIIRNFFWSKENLKKFEKASCIL